MSGRTARPRVPRALLAPIVLVLAVASCAPAPPDARPLVIATTTIVGDLVHEVAGSAATVEVLMPAGADPHDFQPSARQAGRLREADLVVSSGLGLEEGLLDALDAARGEGVPVLELGPLLDPRPIVGSASPDPHWWLDASRAARAVGLVAARMEALASGPWSTNADEARRRLALLDEQLRATFAALPVERRVVVTLHDAFRYFAARYGFEIAGVVLPGGSTHAAPSAQEIAELAATIRERRIRAVFGETTVPLRDAETLVHEAGGDVSVVVLFTGSLGGAGSGAERYAEMMRTNARRIVAALE